MPQKQIYSRAPMLSLQHCFPSNGTIRTADKRISRLYQTANKWIEQPCLWEGLFRIACLTKSKPDVEPVADFICRSIPDTENGAFPGTVDEQIDIARAAFALFEYNTDRTILKRLANWIRYLEIEFDSLSAQGQFLYRPADLMEFLVRFYLTTGSKPVLRLCARLRSSAFDWTTALHTFQQSIPIQTPVYSSESFTGKPDEMDYNKKEHLINHAENLADGVRFTLYSGIFSGHIQDLTSGKTVWDYLSKHHHAICGGTSASPYLSGNAADQPVSNRAIAAWTEAFASQLVMPESEWALDELIRIVFNGLEDCLNQKAIPETQRINTLTENLDLSSDPASLYARITRAVAAAYSHAVSLNQNGFRIHYLLPAKIMLMISRQTVILKMDYESVLFQCRNPFISDIRFYHSIRCTADTVMIREGRSIAHENSWKDFQTGIFLHAKGQWHNQDGFRLTNNGQVFCEETHHRGICFFAGNRLLSLQANKEFYSFAVCDVPKNYNGKYSVVLQAVSKWKIKNEQAADIPVLPETTGEAFVAELKQYDLVRTRITMFPRNHQHV